MTVASHSSSSSGYGSGPAEVVAAAAAATVVVVGGGGGEVVPVLVMVVEAFRVRLAKVRAWHRIDSASFVSGWFACSVGVDMQRWKRAWM